MDRYINLLLLGLSLIIIYKALSKLTSRLITGFRTKNKIGVLGIGQPNDYLLVYIFLIVIFALLYFVFSDFFSFPKSDQGEINLFDTYYFSVVTITTLGYGEIHPIHTFGKILVILQVLSGVFTFGMFLYSISQKYSDQVIENENRIESERKEELRLSLEKHLCLLFDVFDQGWEFGYDRHVTYARPINEIAPFMKRVYNEMDYGIVSNLWNEPDTQVKHLTLLLDSAKMQRDNLTSLIPIAGEISSHYLLTWCSLLTNISNLAELSEKYKKNWTHKSYQAQSELLFNQARIQIQELITYTFVICKIEFKPHQNND